MIDLVLDDLQVEIERVALDAASRFSLRRGIDLEPADLRLLGDVGVFGSGLPDSVGGADCGARAEVIVAQAFGRHLAPLAAIGSVLAAHVMFDAGALSDGLLTAINSGVVDVGIGVRHGSDVWAVDVGRSRLLALIESDGVSLLEVGDGARLVEQSSIDDGAWLATLEGEARCIAASSAPSTRMRSTLLIAATAAGIACVASERAVEYAKQRHQYGRPIGSFQAIKHRCVDSAIRAEAATSLVRLTAARLDAGELDGAAASAAMVVASEAARLNAASAVQVFGGIGFTVEGELDHLIHRAWLLERLAGGSTAHLDAVLAGRRTAAHVGV